MFHIYVFDTHNTNFTLYMYFNVLKDISGLTFNYMVDSSESMISEDSESGYWKTKLSQWRKI